MSFLDEVYEFVKKKQVVYLREAQVLMEKPPSVHHWDVTNAIRKLAGEKKLSVQRFAGQTWYFDSTLSWGVVEGLARVKAELVRAYIDHPKWFISKPEGQRYDDYSEYMIEDCLQKAGFVVFAKSTRYFNGRTYLRQGVSPGRPPDLDFTAGIDGCRLCVGIQCKNLLDYPRDTAIDQLLEICEVLQVRPMLVARIASARQVGRVASAGGYSVLYKRWLLQPPMDNALFNKISDAGKGDSVLGLPVSIYRYTWGTLVGLLREAGSFLGTK